MEIPSSMTSSSDGHDLRGPLPRVSLHRGSLLGIILWANVRGEVSPLAFGIRACSAGEMPKVPKAWGLAPPPR